ncbi:MAG: hypothetical protein ACRC0V_10435, partial [Fusobacteriaceae bacterium]
IEDNILSNSIEAERELFNYNELNDVENINMNNLLEEENEAYLEKLEKENLPNLNRYFELEKNKSRIKLFSLENEKRLNYNLNPENQEKIKFEKKQNYLKSVAELVNPETAQETKEEINKEGIPNETVNNEIDKSVEKQKQTHSTSIPEVITKEDNLNELVSQEGTVLDFSENDFLSDTPITNNQPLHDDEVVDDDYISKEFEENDFSHLNVFNFAEIDIEEAKKIITNSFINATQEEAKLIYRKFAIQYHPDKKGSEELMKYLNNVNDALKSGKFKKQKENIDKEKVRKFYEEIENNLEKHRAGVSRSGSFEYYNNIKLEAKDFIGGILSDKGYFKVSNFIRYALQNPQLFDADSLQILKNLTKNRYYNATNTLSKTSIRVGKPGSFDSTNSLGAIFITKSSTRGYADISEIHINPAYFDVQFFENNLNNDKFKEFVNTIGHELVHKLTIPDLLEDTIARKEIEEIYKTAKEAYKTYSGIKNNITDYALSNLSEFAANYFNSKEFKDFLKTVVVKSENNKKQNLLEKLITVIARFFNKNYGISEKNAYNYLTNIININTFYNVPNKVFVRKANYSAYNASKKQEEIKQKTKNEKFSITNFAPIVVDYNNPGHIQTINNFAEKFKKALSKQPHLYLDNVLASLVGSFSPERIEKHFDIILKAWEIATGKSVTEEQRKSSYGLLFGDLLDVDDSLFAESSDTSLSKKDIVSEPITESGVKITEKVNAPVIITKPNPITDNLEVQYKGYKIADPSVKAAFLGLDYEISADGLEYYTISNSINESAYPAINWNNFKPGDKVTLQFNFDYFKNPNNTMRVWENFDGEKPVGKKVTVEQFLKSIFNASYKDILSLMDTEEGKKKLLSDTEFLKRIPTNFILNGKPTSIGINDYYWWNAANVALCKDSNKVSLDKIQKDTIKEARTFNIETRKKMASNNFSTELEVLDRRSGFQNRQVLTQEEKESGKSKAFQSIAMSFKNNREAAKDNIGFAVLGNNRILLSETEDGKPILKVGNKKISINQIINFEKWVDAIESTGVSASGKAVMIKQINKDEYVINGVITNHSTQIARFSTYNDIFNRLQYYGKILIGQEKVSENTMQKALKFQKVFIDEFGFDIADDSSAFKKFKVFYPIKKATTNSKGEKEYKFYQDYHPFRMTETTANNIPDISKFTSVEEFEEY